MAAKRRRNIITAFTTLPQGRVSTRKHVYTAAITTMWTESSWASTLLDRALERWRTMERQKDSTPPPRWASAQLLYVCVGA